MSRQQAMNESHSNESNPTPESERASFEEWASRSKQIEAERQKAIKALEEEKPSQANLAFLDPKTTKVKGWSKDPDVVAANFERMGNRALIFALGGVGLDLTGYLGSKASTGPEGIILALPSYLSYACLGLAVLMGLVVIGVKLEQLIRRKKKLDLPFWTGLSAVLVVIIYVVVKLFLF